MRLPARRPCERRSGVPFVSVVIPVYNDPTGLSDTLRALTKQDYPADRWEVIVVDNNSTDNTLDMADSFLGTIPKLKILVERKQSSYAARNRGIQEADGEILAFIDADMTVGRDWISRGVHDIESGRGDYVGCRVDIYTDRSPPSIWEIHNRLTGFPVRRYVEEQGYTIGGSLFVRRAVFETVGVFDERLTSGGDEEFGNRVRASGFKLYYDHDNVMRHRARSTFRSVWSKYFRIGKGTVDLRRYYPDRYRSLKPWSFLPVFRPATHVSGILDPSGLGFAQKCGVVFVENVRRLAVASGRMIRYIETRTGLGV